MNNIRGFSYSIPTREASLSHEARNGAEAPPQLESDKNSFENVLTGLSQDSGDAEVTAKPSQQSPLSSLLANEQFAKENGAESDTPTSEGGALGAAGAAAKQGSNTGVSEARPITSAARLGRPDLSTGSTATSASWASPAAVSASTLASGLSRLAASNVAPSAAASSPTQEAVHENTTIDAPNVTEANPAGSGGKPVSPLLRSGERLGNSAGVAVATNSQTGASARAGASSRGLFASSTASPAGKSQRSRGAQDSSQTPPTNGAGAVANAALVVVPVAMLDSYSSGASRSNGTASVPTSALGNPRAPLLEEGADRSVESPDEDSPATQISAQAGVAGQSSFGKSFEMKVNVVSSSTHFAPVARLSPVQQIAGFVVSSLPRLAGGSAGAGEASAVTAPASLDLPLATAQPSATAVKTLNLQLDPASLGQVSIRLNLSGDGLDLEVNADRRTTVDLIEKDKQSLSDQIRQSGYSVAGLEVRLASPAAPNLSSGGGGSNQAMPGDGQATGGSTRGDGSGAHDSPAHTQNQQNSFGSSPRDSNGGTPDRRSARGDLYV